MPDAKTVCPYCGTGCSMRLITKGNQIVEVEADRESPVNEGNLCLKGYFGFHHVASPARLTTPMMRREDGRFAPAGWDAALDVVARKLADIKRESGPDAIVIFSTARSTNEENYVTQKFARAVLGTNNVDHCARLCHAPTTSGLEMTLGAGAMTNTIGELSRHSDVIFICGSNTAECHPIVASHVIKAKARGAKLIVADPRKNEMVKHADLWLGVPIGHDIPLLNAMMHVIIKEGLHKADFIREHTDGFDDLARAVANYPPERVSQMTGIPAEDLVKAGRWYANAGAASTLYAMGVTQFTCGTGNVVSIANLAVITGQIGRPGAGVCPLRGQNNIQGAGDLGAVPNEFPGCYKVTDDAARARFEKAWNSPLSSKIGLRLTEVPAAILDGKVRAVICDGENPMLTDPSTRHFARAVEKLDLLMVTDIFLSETARRAHVVLPACGWGGRKGTFINTERRVQRVRAAVRARGETKAAWWIFRSLSERLGFDGMRYRSPEDVWNEVRTVVPEQWGGVSYARLDKEPGVCHPCPTEDHPGTPILHVGGRFATPSGRAQLKPVLFDPVEVPESERKAFASPIVGHIAERPDADYPFIFTTGRVAAHYHTGNMTRRSPVLEQIAPEALFELNPEDARDLGLRDGEYIRVTTRRGSVVSKAWVTGRVSPKLVFGTFHYWETPANELTNSENLDPYCFIPEFKISAARVVKITPAEAQASVEAQRRYFRQDVEAAAIIAENAYLQSHGDAA